MSRARCCCLRCAPPPPNPAWQYAPPRSGWITVTGADRVERRVYVTEVDACAIAPLLPPPTTPCVKGAR